ncbi:MAG: TrkA family potassium uptake protein [Pseudoflavonifractor sp.]|nr:TrkA family potassium uptake protein [Pseudoflavonifractor sp.]
MRYLIIGLGIYGANLATDLTDLGHEVIGADHNASLVESIKDYISTAYIIDATDETALGVLPLKNVDAVIVAIGENFGASVKTVALLKKAGIKHIYARAIDKLHESILQGFDIDRILTPEQRAAKDLVNEMELGNRVDSLQVDDDNYILKFKAPAYYAGIKYEDLDIAKDFGLRLIAVSRPSPARNAVGIKHNVPKLIDISEAGLRILEDDVWTCFGTQKSYRDMFKRIN